MKSVAKCFVRNVSFCTPDFTQISKKICENPYNLRYLRANNIIKNCALLLLVMSCSARMDNFYVADTYVSEVWVADLGDGRYKNPILYADYSDNAGLIMMGCRFYYSSDGTNFLPFGEPFNARQGKWISAKTGMFVLNNTPGSSRSWVDVDWYRVMNNE